MTIAREIVINYCQITNNTAPFSQEKLSASQSGILNRVKMKNPAKQYVALIILIQVRLVHIACYSPGLIIWLLEFHWREIS